MFARLGVRYMTLTQNDDTLWAASASGLRQTTGLNATGRTIVAEMNRIGMIVDLSHTSESTQLDAGSDTHPSGSYRLHRVIAISVLRDPQARPRVSLYETAGTAESNRCRSPECRSELGAP